MNWNREGRHAGLTTGVDASGTGAEASITGAEASGRGERLKPRLTRLRELRGAAASGWV